MSLLEFFFTYYLFNDKRQNSSSFYLLSCTPGNFIYLEEKAAFSATFAYYFFEDVFFPEDFLVSLVFLAEEEADFPDEAGLE